MGFSQFLYFCPSLITQKLCTNYVEPGKKLARIDQIKSARFQPDHHFPALHVQQSPNTTDNAKTSDSDTNTPFLTDAAVFHLEELGLVD